MNHVSSTIAHGMHDEAMLIVFGLPVNCLLLPLGSLTHDEAMLIVFGSLALDVAKLLVQLTAATRLTNPLAIQNVARITINHVSMGPFTLLQFECVSSRLASPSLLYSCSPYDVDLLYHLSPLRPNSYAEGLVP